MKIASLLAAFAGLLLFCSSAVAAADVTAPTLVGFERVAPIALDVTAAPAAASVRLEISDDISGLYYANVNWNHLATGLYLTTYEFSEVPRKSGYVFLQSPMFTIYHPAGTWKAVSVTLCDRRNNCSNYDNAALDLIRLARSFSLTNTVSPDSGRPSAANGTVITPTVSLASANPLFRVALKLNDAVSGVYNLTVCAQSPSRNYGVCGYGYYSRAVNGISEYAEGRFYPSSNTYETGTWTIYFVRVQDVVGNYRIYDEAAMSTMFPGGNTFELVP